MLHVINLIEGKMFSTFNESIKTQDQRLQIIAGWKTSLDHSSVKRRKTARGSEFFPELELLYNSGGQVSSESVQAECVTITSDIMSQRDLPAPREYTMTTRCPEDALLLISFMRLEKVDDSDQSTSRIKEILVPRYHPTTFGGPEQQWSRLSRNYPPLEPTLRISRATNSL